MNERIRELAEQAGIDFFNSTDPEFVGRVYCEAWTEQQQKFAELIVAECARVAKVSERRGALGWYEIMKHFGIAE